ncbi:MAG: hypothetical protein U0599_28495 [Vicinamibacteria bacterium]
MNSPARFYGASGLVRRVLPQARPLVASVHAKDLAWDVEMAVHFREVRIGTGSIDYGVLLTEHARHAPDAPLMLEHLPGDAEYDAGARGGRGRRTEGRRDVRLAAADGRYSRSPSPHVSVVPPPSPATRNSTPTLRRRAARRSSSGPT